MPKVLQDILPRPGQSTIFRGQVAPDQKGINDPEFGAYWYGDNSGKNSKGEDAPSNKGVNDPEFGAYWYGDNSNKESKGEDAPSNKGVNDPEFGAYWYGDNSNKESKGEDAPANKGVTDPEFGAYWYGDNSNKESKGEDAPANKGVNDPEVGAYAYDPEYKGSVKVSKGVNEPQSRGENAPSNKGPNDPEFGNYAYDSEYKGLVKESRGNINSSGRKSKTDNTAVKETIYFLPKDLLPGKKVNLPRLVQKRDRGTFLPHLIAESIPLSSDKLPEILKNFSLKDESRDANNVKITVKNCERAEMKGEEKYCATSLESFVDMSVSMLGKEIRLLSNELRKETKNPLFTIARAVRNMGENDIVCHKMKYPYAVYLCHSIKKTVVYKVPLVGTDGTKANAVAVCHKDTSAWSPNHIAFKVLKVKPGAVPICHFLGRDTLVWVPN
ncbi:LOW QUALITY PROTEIN: BURP domain-containing protein 8-like [Herrania umbratica]|uniref:LOW QUALITY PROTEIN: BURP domain-containing protein 8-like n=1 Tax=Herrania umbratica TaxID=108875 RepID=A0A6J0ZXV7_9ROSI|nr:LOW QUALITY PROTEIN: BURP domain-containing protein 8-like [Herrania umbratica]